MAVGASTLTLNWVLEHDTEANFFPEFAGRVLYLSDLLLFAGVLIWIIGRFLSTGRSFRCGPRYVFIPLLLLTVLTALSVVWAGDASQAGIAAVRRGALFALYLIIVNDADRVSVPMAVVCISTGLIHAVVGIAQVLSGSALGLSQLGEMSVRTVGCPRAYGLGFHPNPAGLFLAVAAAVGYGLLRLVATNQRTRALTLLSFGVIVVGLGLTRSRSALTGWLLAVLAVTSLATFWSAESMKAALKRYGVIAVVVLLLVAVPVSFSLKAGRCQRVAGRRAAWSLSGISREAVHRLTDVSLALPIISGQPVLGVGAGNYALALKDGPITKNEESKYTPVHNVWALLFAELGILGFVGWGFIMASPVVWVALRWRQVGVPRQALLWLGPLLVLLFESLLEFTPWATQDGRVLLMAMLGLWAGGTLSPPSGTRRDGLQPRTAASSGTGS